MSRLLAMIMLIINRLSVFQGRLISWPSDLNDSYNLLAFLLAANRRKINDADCLPLFIVAINLRMLSHCSNINFFLPGVLGPIW